MIDTIIDINHAGQPDFNAMAAAGIVAVIHKATEGATYRDPEYRARRPLAKAAGLLWGSYHYVSGTSLTDQLDNYLAHAAPTNDELVCIDYERSTSGPDMSLAQLERLVVLLTQRLQRVPVIYGGDLLRSALGLNASSVLAQCPLWYSRYSAEPTGVPPAVWRKYTLWQYTDGASGPEPHTVPGLGRCDRSRFEGTASQLRQAWPFLIAPPNNHAALGNQSTLTPPPMPLQADRPDDFVMTPGGRRRRSHVHLIGRDRPYMQGRHARLALLRREQPGPPDQSNWITCAGWLNESGTPVSSISGTWQVPPAPATAASQLIYLFNGLEPGDGSTIVQPVLQWGDSGPDEDNVQRTGPFWSVACWMVPGPDGHTYHTPHVPVRTGDILTGTITLVSSSASGFVYSCEFAGIAAAAFTTPPLPELTWCMQTLEAYELNSSATPPYDLNAASEYPSGSTAFRAINIFAGGTVANVQWTVQNIVTQFGEQTVTVANSGSNGQVDVIY